MGLSRADESVDRRRQRRALTEEELTLLLDAARRRPLLKGLTVRHGRRKGEAVAKVGIAARKALEALGWERALIYKTRALPASLTQTSRVGGWTCIAFA